MQTDLPCRYLNLGCGRRFHPDWINMDVISNDPRVIQADLSHCVPLPDNSCKVVYHAAVLEHFRSADALPFLRECLRVLQPGGFLRIGVPDLAHLCQLYLEKLAAAEAGNPDAAHDYDWIMLEIFDQMIRERSGGKMLHFLSQNPLPNQAFVYDRIGEEGRELVEQLRQSHRFPTPGRLTVSMIRRIVRIPKLLKEKLLTLLLTSQDHRAMEIGRFRLSGEVHQWMYDRWSLARLLCKAGFTNPVLRDAKTSGIPDWQYFHLDTLSDGTVIKPDLLFMEAIKSEKSCDDR